MQQRRERRVKAAVSFQFLIVQHPVLLAGAPQLDAVGAYNPEPHLGAGFPPFILQRLQAAGGEVRHLDVYVDPVQQRAGNLVPVTPDLSGSAAAAAVAVVKISAWAGVQRRDKLEPGGEFGLARSPGNADPARFQRFPQCLQDVAVEFRQLVQEQDAVVRQRYLAGTGHAAAAHQGNG